MRTTDHRSTRLFIFLAGFFLTNALIAEFVGVEDLRAGGERRERRRFTGRCSASPRR